LVAAGYVSIRAVVEDLLYGQDGEVGDIVVREVKV